MAFRRRYMRRRARRGGFKRKFTLKHRSGGAGPRPELKFVDVLDSATQAFSTIAAGGTATGCVNIVNEGSGAWNRIGRRINMKSIEVRICLANLPAATPAAGAQIYRILLVYDAQWNGSSGFTYASLLQSRSIAGAGATGILSPVNLDNRDRFLILRDWIWTDVSVKNVLDPLDTAANASSAMCARLPRQLHWYHKLRGLETVFGASTGSSTDINTGALLLITVCSAATPYLTCNVSTRLRFYD